MRYAWLGILGLGISLVGCGSPTPPAPVAPVANPPVSIAPPVVAPPGGTINPAAPDRTAERAASEDKLKKLALAILTYESNQSQFPQSLMGSGLSWRVHMLPFLGEQDLYAQFNLNEPWDSATNKPLAERMPAAFKHPIVQTAQPNMTTYVLPVGPTTLFPTEKALTFRDLARDGANNTALVLSVDAANAVIWTKPDDWQYNAEQPFAGLGNNWGDGSFEVSNVAGQPYFFDIQANAEQFRNFITSQGGEAVNIDLLKAKDRHIAPPTVGTTAASSTIPFTPSATSAARAATVAPYLDDQTTGIIFLDMAAINFDAAMAELTRPDRKGPPVTQEQIETARKGTVIGKEFQKYVKEAYIVLSMNDLPAFPPFGVIKLQPGADAKKLFAYAMTMDVNAPLNQKLFDESTIVNNDILIVGGERAIYKLRNPNPTAVPNLEAAFAFAGDAPFQAIFIPTDTARDTLGRLIPSIPPEFGIDGPAITRGIKFAAFSMKPTPGFEMRLEAQATDATSAQILNNAISKGFDKLQPFFDSPVEQMFINAFRPQLNGDRFSVALKEGDPVFDHLQKKAMEQLAENQRKAGGGIPSFPGFGFGKPSIPQATPNPMPLAGEGLPPMPAIGPDGQPIATEPPFIAAAKKAFFEGKETEGMQYLYAEALAGEDKDNLKGSLRWAPGLKRPTMAIRWGVGIQYNAPRNYASGPAPIGRPQAGVPQQGNNNQPGGDPAMPKFDAPPATVLDYFVAELGVKVVDGLRTRVDVGQFGDVLTHYREVPLQPSGAPNEPPKAAVMFKPTALAPGVLFVGVEKGGTGGQKELITTAKKEGLDALIIYDVAVSPSRTFIGNNTKIMLFDLTKGEALHASKVLKNTAVELARKEGKGTDPVEDVIERLFTAVDESFMLADLPAALNETNVTARVQKLADAPPENKLPLLVEIAFWQQRGLLSPDNAAQAYEKVLGPDGAKLAGTPEERQTAVLKLLPKSARAPAGRTTTGPRIGLP